MTYETIKRGMKSGWDKNVWKQCRAATGVWPDPTRCQCRTDHESELCGRHSYMRKKVKEE